ncbi:MAG TPA: hypothetical protein VKU93_01140 [Terracidiphilus sp.]|nr:hypothetical protein [Terracidiphilus sp.]
MRWAFEVVAAGDRRLLSRILQALENQMVSIHSFHGEIRDDAARVRFVISSEEDKSYRIKAILYRIENVISVSASEQESVEIPGIAAGYCGAPPSGA